MILSHKSHLSVPDFISEEVVGENTNIRVSMIERLVEDNIWPVGEFSMERVILKSGGV